MKNRPIELYNSITKENGFSVLFLGSNTQYNETMQNIYNMHWNSVVTTFDLNDNPLGITAEKLNDIENYRKVNCIRIGVDVENRKNLFNKKKLIAISVDSCLTEKKLRYITVFDNYLNDLCNKLVFDGTLVVDGITVDEYDKLDINRHIWDLHKGNVFFFRCSEELKDRIINDLGEEEAETFSFFSEGVEEYLEEYLEADDEFEYDEDSASDFVYYFSGGKRRSFEKRKLIDSSGIINLISTDDINGKKVAPFLSEQYFYAFIKDSKNAPQWYAYENELTIKRDIEAALLKKVKIWLTNPGAVDKKKKERKQRILCVSGQSCSGKSVTIAKTAFEIFKEQEFPVVYIDKRTDFSYTSEHDPKTLQTYTKNENLRMLCELLDRLKDDGAKSVLLVWDISAYYNDMRKYVELANSLESRNVNFTLLCSSYTLKEDFLKNEFPEVSCMPLPVLLSEEELSEAAKIFRKKANMPREQIDRLMKVAGSSDTKSNLLELIYFLYSSARDALALGIKKEAWVESQYVFEDLLRKNLEDKDFARMLGERILRKNIELSCEKAEDDQEEPKTETNNIISMVNLLAFCTKINRSVPLMLVLNCFGLMISDINKLSMHNVIDYVSDNNGDIRLSIRSRLEAEMLLGDSADDIRKIVDLIGELIEKINPYSDDNVLLLRDILFNIGPNSKDAELKEQFAPYLETILEYLKDFRENGGDPRITLQEITITREHYWRLYGEHKINCDELKSAITRSIKIGRDTADGMMVDRSLKYKILGEVAQQKMLPSDPSEKISFDGLLMDLSPADLREVMKNMIEAIQYEPDNTYYYVNWMKAAGLLLSNEKISKDEKQEIMEAVFYIDSSLNESHTAVKETTHYQGVYANTRNLIDGEGEDSLKKQIERGVSAAGYVLAFKKMGDKLTKKLYPYYGEERLTADEIELLNGICKDCLVRFAEVKKDKMCFKLLLKIKKCVFNGGNWQNYQRNSYKNDNAGTTSVSAGNWNELCRLCTSYYNSFVMDEPYIRDSYDEIYLLALASAQAELYTSNNTETIFAKAIRLLQTIRNDRNIFERQIEGKMDSRQFLCDEQGRIVLFAGQTTKKKNLTQLWVKLDGMRDPVFANINDLRLQNDTVSENMRDYFAISFGYMGLKAHRFDNKATVRFGNLGRAE